MLKSNDDKTDEDVLAPKVSAYYFGAKKTPLWFDRKNNLIFVKYRSFCKWTLPLKVSNDDKTDEDILAPKVSAYDFGTKKTPLWFDRKNYLIFVKRAVFVSGLSLLLKGNDDKTDEDIDHEEGNDNDVNEIKDSNDGTEVVDGSNVFSIGIDRNIKDARPAFKGGYHE